MESLVRAALVGTARQGAGPAAGAAPTDGLVARLGDLDAERSLLLRAGALAAYRLAGRAPGGEVIPLEAAPAETAPYCSPAAADLIWNMLDGTQSGFLPDTLARLRRAGLILPPELLVALIARPRVLWSGLDELAQVIGMRGRWLAAQNPAWGWVREVLDEREPPPANADAIWEEGDSESRRNLFRRMRRADPARAREWLAAVWASEKADLRAKLVGMLHEGLSADDEPLLTHALADNKARGHSVQELLARLPESAFAARMRERADALLDYAAGELHVKLPTESDPAWAQDGLGEVAQSGTSGRTFVLMEVLAYVPPAHWSERFGLGPEELVAAADKAYYWAPLIEGWSRAVLLHRDAIWAPALWEWCLEPQHSGKLVSGNAEDLRNALGMLVPQVPAEERVARVLSDPDDPARANLFALVATVPKPWSANFGGRFLDAMREAAADASAKQGDADNWDAGVVDAMSGLPSACYAAALAPWTVHEPEQERGKSWQQLIETFTEAVDFRRRIAEAIPLDE